MAYSPPVMTLIFIKAGREKARAPISFAAAKTCSHAALAPVTCSASGARLPVRDPVPKRDVRLDTYHVRC
jgi:hypothetical protein